MDTLIFITISEEDEEEDIYCRFDGRTSYEYYEIPARPR